MRPVTYYVASSLDGRIADSDGSFDWLLDDQDYGLSRFMTSVDTVLMGQATYDYLKAHGVAGYPGKTNIVFSRTLHAAEHPGIWVIDSDPAPFVQDLKRAPGRGIWIVGGGVISRYLLQADLVDHVVVAVHPLLLGGGIPLLPEGERRTELRLEEVVPYDSGLVTLSYAVQRGRRPEPLAARGAVAGQSL